VSSFLSQLAEQTMKKPALLLISSRTATDALEVDPVTAAIFRLHDVVVARDKSVVEPAGFDAFGPLHLA